jgi:hypothetical protein
MKQLPLVKSLQLSRKAKARGRVHSTVEQGEAGEEDGDDAQLNSIRTAVVGKEENSMQSMVQCWCNIAR